MASIPVIAFSAWSGTGKTTLIEQLIRILKEKGFRVAAVKHDAHDFEIDRKGKDSWRFTHAGADLTVISSAEKTAYIEQRPVRFPRILSGIRDVDVILTEGYNDFDPKEANHPFYRIGIRRAATGKGFRLPLTCYDAVVTDGGYPADIPAFPLQDPVPLADYLIRLIKETPRSE